MNQFHRGSPKSSQGEMKERFGGSHQVRQSKMELSMATKGASMFIQHVHMRVLWPAHRLGSLLQSLRSWGVFCKAFLQVFHSIKRERYTKSHRRKVAILNTSMANGCPSGAMPLFGGIKWNPTANQPLNRVPHFGTISFCHGTVEK